MQLRSLVIKLVSEDRANNSVCVSVFVSCAKTAEPIETPFGTLTRVGPRKHLVDGGPDPSQKGALLRGTYVGPM